jgi:hypothetical protein
MELPDEVLKLLREIRDNQRELLAFTQDWRAESDRRYRKWESDKEQDRKEYEASRAKWDENNAVWEKANEAYLRSSEEWLRGNKTARTMALIFVTVFLVVLGIGGALAALGWIE